MPYGIRTRNKYGKVAFTSDGKCYCALDSKDSSEDIDLDALRGANKEVVGVSLYKGSFANSHPMVVKVDGVNIVWPDTDYDTNYDGPSRVWVVIVDPDRVL